MIKGLAHMCFVCRDLKASLDFYCGKLGLKEVFDFRNDKGERFGVYLHVGGRCFIEIFQGSAPPQAFVDKYSYQHFCLEVDDIQSAVAKLRAAGVSVTDVKMGGDNSWQAWLADPDGNRIELHHYTPTSKQAAAFK